MSKKIIKLSHKDLVGCIRESLSELDLYHGTKADFEKFDMAYLSTGWGAQAYGDGFYLSTSFECAKEYSQGVQVMTCRVPNGPYLSYMSVRSETKRKVAEAFFKYYTEENEYGREAYGTCKREFWENECRYLLNASTGADLYGDIAAITGSHQETIKFLRRLGYIGLKFKGENTDTGEKFMNYVIFDADDIQIIEKTPVGDKR